MLSKNDNSNPFSSHLQVRDSFLANLVLLSMCIWKKMSHRLCFFTLQCELLSSVATIGISHHVEAKVCRCYIPVLLMCFLAHELFDFLDFEIRFTSLHSIALFFCFQSNGISIDIIHLTRQLIDLNPGLREEHREGRPKTRPT